MNLQYIKNISQLPSGIRKAFMELEKTLEKTENLKEKSKKYKVETGESFVLHISKLGETTRWSVNGKELDKR